jgi:dTDP-4-amino-4,6-dideoxygalactose transaminase
VDIEPTTCLIDESKITDAITEKTEAIVPVHLFGRMCNMPAIKHIAKTDGLLVIEDAAQAFGAEMPWPNGTQEMVKAGMWGDAGCFSFYKTKSFSTFEGGCITVPDDSRLDPIRVRRITRDGTSAAADEGDTMVKSVEKYTLKDVGFNFRMSEPCALVGLERLKLHRPSVTAELGRYGPWDGYYPRVVYDQPIYRKLWGDKWEGSCPVAEEIANRVRHGDLCLLQGLP